MFGEGIHEASLAFGQLDGSDIFITLLDEQGNPTSDSVTFENRLGSSLFNHFTIRFADQSEITWDTILSLALTINGTPEDDVLNGSRYDDTILGFAGDDEVTAGEGNDSVWGGAGDDDIRANSGDDIVYGEAGNDAIDLHTGDDSAFGGDGNDYIIAYSGNNVLNGGAGDDEIEIDRGLRSSTADNYYNIVSGDAGNDSIYLNHGNDRVLYEIGDGEDTIYSAGGDNKVVFGAGITQSSIAISRIDESDVVVTLLDGSDEPTTDRLLFTNALGRSATSSYFTFEFTDGSTTSWENIIEQALILFGTDNDDELFGTRYEDKIYGLEGNDVIRSYLNTSSSAVDWVDGGAGDDQITTSNGDDTILGGAGNDTISAGSGRNTVDAGDGDDFVIASAGYNVLSGGAGNDEIEIDRGLKSSTADDYYNIVSGDAGNDSIYLNYGNDRVLFDVGDGEDTIYSKGGKNKVVFGAAITQNSIEISRIEESDVVITLLNSSGEPTTDRLILTNALSKSENSHFFTLEFTDSTTVLWSSIREQALTLYGTDNDDELFGTRYEDKIYGLEGNDVIQSYLSTSSSAADWVDGGAGDDQITTSSGNDYVIGGTGNDRVKLGTGNDQYFFDIGHGQDYIEDSGGSDKVVFGSAIDRDNLKFGQYSNSLVIELVDTNGTATQDNLLLWGWVNDSNRRIESIILDNGDFISYNEIKSIVENTVKAPSFNRQSGEYRGAQSITISSATTDAQIYYTIDGSPPSTISTLYENSFTVEESVLIRAIAVKSGLDSSVTTSLDLQIIPNTVPSIEGVPASTAFVDQQYLFEPVANDDDGDPLTFSVTNAPAWMSLDTVTGVLSGTPSENDKGEYPNVVLSVTDGFDSVVLESFTLTVVADELVPPTITITDGTEPGSFTISWEAVSGAATYKLEEEVNGAGFSLVEELSGTSKTFYGKQAATYRYRLQACPQVGDCSGYSVAQSFVEALQLNQCPVVETQE